MRNEKECVCTRRTPSFRKKLCFVWDVPAAHNWSHLLRCNHHNSYIYGNLQHFVNQLGDKEFSIGYFQQDGATSRTSHASMAKIQSFFGDRVILKRLWPPHSPDLTPSDYFLWGYLKGRVYQNKPRTTDALKANITEEIQAVTADILARTFQKYGALFSILSGRKLWPLPAHGMMSSHFLHNEVSSLQISLQYSH